MTTKLAIASDHAGYALKTELVRELREAGHEVLDLGPDNEDRVDYPDFGFKLAEAVASGAAERGIVICGSGIGISIAANRHPAVRAALCTSGLMARLARQHNDANVLALGSRIIGIEVARDCVAEFLATPFEGGRHAGRVAKLGTILKDASA
jgi:ribose 5-phosphate isomerase B